MKKPVLIVGGGPAGSASATLLARAGASVTLIERSAGPHDKVCGDFLSGPALARLRSLGLSPASLGAAPIERVRLIRSEREAESPLPFPAAGLSRRVLDEALLRLAAEDGARVIRGQPVRDITRPERASVLLATGKHDVPGLRRPGGESGALGFKTYLVLSPDQARELAGTVELVLLPGGYAGLQPVEGGRVALCAMFRRPPPARPAELLGWLAESAPRLRRRLEGARWLLQRPLAVSRVPYGHLQAPDSARPWLFRVGDQAAVIPSLAGDGVAIALHSAILATRAVLSEQDAVSYHRRLRRTLARPMRAAMTVHRLALQPEAQPLLIACCRIWPGLIRFTAALTRCYQPPLRVPT